MAMPFLTGSGKKMVEFKNRVEFGSVQDNVDFYVVS